MMIYNEIKRDLFNVGSDYALVHCISADFCMGRGIAKTFADLGCREELLRIAPDYNFYNGPFALWTSIPLDEERHPKGVYHLVTKDRYFHKPTYQDMFEALFDLRYYAHYANDGDKIAMPKIGCGLDKLEWSKVLKIIFDVFEKTDFEILVCSLN